MTRRAYVAIAVLTGATFACADEVTRPEMRPVGDGGIANEYSASATMPMDASSTEGRVGLGSYADWTIVDVKLTGETKDIRTTSCAAPYCTPPWSAGAMSRQSNHRGFAYTFGCEAATGIFYMSGTSFDPTGCVSGGSTGGSATFTQAVKGNVEAIRTPSQIWWCYITPPSGGMVPCVRYEGYSTVDLEYVEADLALDQSTDSSSTPGATVIFTATSLPETHGGYDIPVVVRSWKWFDRNGYSDPECGTSTICLHNPTTSGLMYVEGLANGRLSMATAAVVIPDSGSSNCGGEGLSGLYLTCDDSTGGGEGGGGPTLSVACVDAVSGDTLIDRGAVVDCTISQVDTGAHKVVDLVFAANLIAGYYVELHALKAVYDTMPFPIHWRGGQLQRG